MSRFEVVILVCGLTAVLTGCGAEEPSPPKLRPVVHSRIQGAEPDGPESAVSHGNVVRLDIDGNSILERQPVVRSGSQVQVEFEFHPEVPLDPRGRHLQVSGQSVGVDLRNSTEKALPQFILLLLKEGDQDGGVVVSQSMLTYTDLGDGREVVLGGTLRVPGEPGDYEFRVVLFQADLASDHRSFPVSTVFSGVVTVSGEL